jgi:hypothetical protein
MVAYSSHPSDQRIFFDFFFSGLVLTFLHQFISFDVEKGFKESPMDRR